MDPASVTYSSYQSEIQQDANDAEVKTENIRCKICQQIHCDVRIVGCGCLIHTVSNQAIIPNLNDRNFVFSCVEFHDPRSRQRSQKIFFWSVQCFCQNCWCYPLCCCFCCVFHCRSLSHDRPPPWWKCFSP